jgi:tetratricopeptide (TPR) repeat protein
LQREIPHKKLAALRKQQAQRSATKTVALYPDHWLQEQTYLCLGNIAFWDGRLEDASAYYEEVTQRFENNTVVKAAWFNLAKVYWAANDRRRCRESLYHVVDQAVGSPLESIAYYFLGLIAIGDQNPDEASKLLGRSLSLSKDDRLRALAAIYMCTAQLLADNPHAANHALSEYRELIRQPEWQDQGVFLTALTRYRAAASTKAQINEGRALVAALATIDPRKFDGAIGYFLVGQAFDELGYSARAEQIYSQGASVRGDELRNAMVFRMAEIAFEAARWNVSKEHLELLVNGDNEAWSRRAKLQFAKADYEQANYDACLNTALQLLPQCNQQSEKVVLLELAGKAFEKKNNYYQAALCFAGMMPSDSYLAEATDESYSPATALQR